MTQTQLPFQVPTLSKANCPPTQDLRAMLFTLMTRALWGADTPSLYMTSWPSPWPGGTPGAPFPRAQCPGVHPGSLLSFLPECLALAREHPEPDFRSALSHDLCAMEMPPSAALPPVPPQGHFPCDLSAPGSRAIPTRLGCGQPFPLLCSPSHSPEGKQVCHQAPRLINSQLSLIIPP